MILFLSILTILSFLTSIGTFYYAFFRQPNRLKELNKYIYDANSSKKVLSEELKIILDEKSKLQLNYNQLKANTETLQEEWNKLNYIINVGNQQLIDIETDKQKNQNELQSIRVEFENLKTNIESNSKKASQISQELNILTKQKEQLASSINNIKGEVQQLQKDKSDLLVRKSDLEKENSHLSREIKKKITELQE